MKLTKLKTNLALGLTGILFAAGAVNAATHLTVTEIIVNDSGNANGDITIAGAAYLAGTAITAGTLDTDGDLNLIGFTAGGTNYSTVNYVSGVGTTSTINSSTLDAVIQPNAFLTSAPTSFYTGSSTNVASYLTTGSRGLSFSTALNFKAADNPATIIIPMQFLSDPTSAARATFIIGDGADNQSADLWEFLDVSNNVIGSFTLDDTFFNTFGDQAIDRVKTDGSGFVGSASGDSLGMALGTVNLEASDFTGNYADVTQLRITIPESGTEPKTDYAFIGVDTALVSSITAVVPEPSSLSLFGLATLSLFLVRRRQ